MNLFGLSPGELVLILMVAMIVLGPEKLPETAASIGRWIREFRRVTAELTAQFADENPFTEIQRALSLADEPAPATMSPETVAEVAGDSKPGYAEVAATASSTASISQSGSLVVPRRSDYFDYPSYYAAIDESWTHSGLSGYHGRGSQAVALLEPIDDEWVHGVPMVIPPPVVRDLAVAEDELGTIVVSADDIPDRTVGDETEGAVSPGLASFQHQPIESPGVNGLYPQIHRDLEQEHDDSSTTVGAGVGHREERAP